MLFEVMSDIQFEQSDPLKDLVIIFAEGNAKGLRWEI